MLAARLTSRAARLLDTSVPQDLIFRLPTFEAWAQAALTPSVGSADSATPSQIDADRLGARRGPVSMQQEELLEVEAMLGPSPVNNAVVVVELSHNVEESALRQAFAAVIQRHPMLMASFDVAGEDTVMTDANVGIAADGTWFETSDGHSTERIRKQVARTALAPFDLASGPLVRVQLIRRADAPDLLALHAHHAVMDGVSAQLVLDEVDRAVGSGAFAPPPEATYVDYALWQRENLDKSIADAAGHWRSVVRRLAAAGVGIDDDPSAGPAPLGRVHCEIPAGTLDAARVGFPELGVTDFVLLSAAVARTIGRIAARDMVGIGILCENRSQPEFEAVVGPFATSSLLPVEIPAAGPGADLQLVRTLVEGIDAARRWAGLPLPIAVRDAAAEAGIDSADELVDVVVSIDYSERHPGAGALGLRRLFDIERPVVGIALSRPPSVLAVVDPDGSMRIAIDHRATPHATELAEALADGISRELVALASTR
jgi:hypothetical protein